METVQLLVWCTLTCQNGPDLCKWGDFTATTKSKRSLQIIQTHIRQLWGQKHDYEHPFPLCNIPMTCSDSFIVFTSSLIFGMSGCACASSTFIMMLVVLSGVLQVLGEIRLQGWRTGEEASHQVEQLPAKDTAGSGCSKITKSDRSLKNDCRIQSKL